MAELLNTQIQDEKSSIQTAEEVIKRRKRLTRIIRRTLLITITTIILIVAGVFFFDQYKDENPVFDNEYDKEYWSALSGFKHYDEWYNELVNTSDMNNAAYVSPFTGKNTVEEKLAAARYQEELDLILSPYTTTLKDINTKINDLTDSLFGYVEGNTDYNRLKNAWICYILLGNGYLSDSSKSAVESFKDTTLTTSEIDNALQNNTLTYTLVKSKGYTGDISDYLQAMLAETYVVNTLTTFTDRYDYIVNLSGIKTGTLVDAFAKVVEAGYTGTETTFYANALRGGNGYARLGLNTLGVTEEMFASYLYNDTGHNGGKTCFERAVVPADEGALADLISSRNTVELIVNDGNTIKAALPSWSKYIRTGALGYQKVAEKGNYEFWLNIALTTFKVVDKTDPLNPVEWYSNPTSVEDGTTNNLLNVLELSFGKTGSSPTSYGTYSYAVSPSFKNNSKGVEPNYATKIFDTISSSGKASTTIQVWYRLEERGINYTYFPKYIQESKVQELMERNASLVEQGAEYESGMPVLPLKELLDKDGINAYTKLFEGKIYRLVTETNANNQFGGERYYEFSGTIANVSSINMATMYYLYQHCGFTQADLEEQNDFFQNISNEMNSGLQIANEEPNDASFTIAIQYELSEDGLEVTIPGASITETGDDLVVYVDALEYFTASKVGTEGYTIIPDGSGAILNHDNGKTSYNPYIKRLYTTDLSMTTNVLQQETEDIMLPMYAVVNTADKMGVIADVTKGAAQLELNADVSGRGKEDNNKNYFRIYYRESQNVKISTYANEITKYNANIMSSDISIAYKFLEGDVVSEGYSGVAKMYRELLVNRYGMQDKKDTTDELVVDIDVLGSYQFKNNFLGIVYDDKQTLTTYEQLKQIISSIESIDIQNINVFYKGWRNSTLVDKSFKSFNSFNELGKLSELAEIEDDEKVTVYPYVNFGLIQEYQETFGKYHYNARNVIGDIITIYPYDLSTNVWNKKAQEISILSPRYYVAFANSLIDSYNKLFKVGKKNEVLTNLTIDNLGSNLTGDYQKDNEMYKINSVQEQIKVLEALKSSGITNINLYKPYDYAFKYVSNAKDIPYTSTQYEILNYSIPFYQLVVNGLFDYSGESVNANSEDGINQHIMKILETGSNISFIFTYENSEKLLATDYNQYYFTHYEQWLSDVENIYDSVKACGVEGSRLVKHEYLGENVYKVTYQNESTLETTEIIINYSRVRFTDSISGQVIPAKSYKVL